MIMRICWLRPTPSPARFRAEPGLVDVDTFREVPIPKLVFVTDQEKAALAGVSVADVAETHPARPRRGVE